MAGVLLGSTFTLKGPSAIHNTAVVQKFIAQMSVLADIKSVV